MEVINSFPGYEYKDGKNIYRGDDLGKGGYVYAEPGMYYNVALLDVASLHPHSIVAMNCFGEYTKNFEDLMNARVSIKHGDYESVRHMFGGKLTPYLEDESTAKELAQALKIAINSVYGLTSANFDNPFRDIRNKNNIVALRGALFMRTLQDEIVNRGFRPVHIKTDSIKIPNATREIIQFCMDFAKQYGYTFEHEATYDRMCLVNNAVYIAKYATAETCEKLYGYVPGDCKKKGGKWTATGTQFQIPYVFKTLFSKELIGFEDLCETKSVQTALYLDMNENLPDVTEYEKEYDKLWRQITDERKLSDPMNEECKRVEELTELIAKGHNYIFIGRVGRFCPIKPGCGGGVLCREATDNRTGGTKYVSATGAKDYRWLESEMVRDLGKEDDIDKNYYRGLVDEAIRDISEYGDFEQFVSDNDPNDEPPWFNPDEPYIDELDHTPFDVR